ncbi:hypothetical protein [Actinoallomurus sp. NPDC052274]|uniref:hypothetical protein n=1 Tax=Actinoallomurus sp. NPDC052274 TaxID=3155420 RepID=UPI003449D6C7
METTRIGKLIDQRRRELGYARWRDLADAAGVSHETIRKIRRGIRDATTHGTLTESKLEDALQWARGSLQTIDEGGEPTRVHPTLPIPFDWPSPPEASEGLREPGIPAEVSARGLAPYAREMYERLTLVTDSEIKMLIGMIRETRRSTPEAASRAQSITRRKGFGQT